MMIDLITVTSPQSAAVEAYHSLRTNIEFASLEQPLNTLLITSADPSTEKSVSLANLGVAMAEAGDRVILIDGDLRRPQQHEIFALHNQQGVTSWLTDNEPIALQQTSVDGLQVLTAGPTVANPVSLLSTKRLAELLNLLKEQADYILCDAPPLLSVTDSALWASVVDGVVLLVNAGGTKRHHAQQAKAVLEKVHAHVIGAVLLNAEPNVAVSGYDV